MKREYIIIGGLVAGALSGAPALRADATSDAIQELKQQIQNLDQKVRILERQKELDTDVATAKEKDAPKITVGNAGLSVASGDTNFVFALHGLVQTDNRTFFNDH